MHHSGGKYLKNNLNERSQGQHMRPGDIQDLVDFLKGNQMQRETTEMRMKRRDPLPDIGKTANLRNIDLDRSVNINIEETQHDNTYNELEIQQQEAIRSASSPPASMLTSPRGLNTRNVPSVLPQSLGPYGNEVFPIRKSKTKNMIGSRRPVANVRNLPPIQRAEPLDRPSAPEPRADIVIPSEFPIDADDDINGLNARLSDGSFLASMMSRDDNTDNSLSPIEERNDSRQEEYSNNMVLALRREFSDVTLNTQSKKSQSQINTCLKQGRETAPGISRESSDVLIRPASPNVTRTLDAERPWAPEPSSAHTLDMDKDGEPVDFIDVN